MAINEIANAKVYLDGAQAAQEIKKLEERARELRTELAKLGKDNDLAGFRQKEKELKLVNSQMKNFKQSTWDVEQVLKNLNGRSLNELTRAQRQLSAEIKSATRNTKEEITAYNEKVASLKKVNTAIAQVKNETQLVAKSQQSWLSNAAQGFNKYFAIVTAGIAAFTGVAMSIKSMIQGNVELDDSLADVMKTTGLTKKETRELYSEFKTLNTRTPRKELLGLAEEAGRLGIEGKKSIMDFVEAGNQIKVSLGDDLGDAAGEAIQEVGKIAMVFKVGEKYGTDFKKAMLMVGSSINEVSANSSANAPFLIDMAKRMAGVSSQAGVSVQDIIGYAAALDSMGQTSEISSTTLNKVIVSMFKDVDEYASLAKMSSEEFFTLLQTDANDALLKVLGGLNGNNEGLATMATKLDSLGLDGARSVQVLAALASNIDLVKKQQDLANSSLEQGTSLTREYMIKNNNMAGGLQKIGVAIRSAFVSSGINEALTGIITKVAKWIEIPVSRTMEEQRIKVNALTIELTDSNTEEQRRKDIYDELRDISPKIIEGINLEAINIDKLRQNLALYNEEQIKKIALQKAGESQGESQEQLGLAIAERLKSEEELRQKLVNIQGQASKYDKEKAEQINNILLSEDDLLEKENKIQKIVEAINVEQKINMLNGTYAANAAFSVTNSREKELALQKENNKELAAYQEMYRSIMGTTPGASPSAVPIDGGLKTVVDYEPGADKKDKAKKDLEKLLEQQAEFRMQLIVESKSLIEQENIAYEQRLKDAGIFGKKRENLTGEYLEASYLLEQQHNDKIKGINDKALDTDILKNKEVFDLVTQNRLAAFNTELAALGDNEKAKTEAKKRFEKQELQRQQRFLVALLAELQGTVEGQDVFKGIDETLLSEEQKEKLRLRIAEVKLALSDLGVKFGELSGKGEDKKEEKKESVDIFGMSSEDWKTLIQHIMDGKFGIEDLIAAAGALTNAVKDYYDIKNNLDQQDLQRTEATIEKQKASLKKKLDTGVISQEAYNSQIAGMDATLDAKRKEIALKAAKRERNIALMNAVVNTAAGVVKMLNNPFPLNIILAALVGIMGGFQIAKIVTTPLPQAASGKYDVIGAQDGKKYNAKLLDSPGTGLVKSPAIIVGEQPEIIIDPYTTRNLQMNFPEVIQAINAARVPQYASGKYPSDSSTTATAGSTYLDELAKTISELEKTNSRQNTILDRLTLRLDKGISAKLVADGDYVEKHNEVMEDYDALHKQVNLRS